MFDLPANDQNQNWIHVNGLALPMAVAELYQQTDGLLLLLTDSVHHSRQLEHELSVVTAGRDLSVFHFPLWDTLPYDVFSPNPELISERLKFLQQISVRNDHGIVVMPVQNLMQKVPSKDFINGRSFHVKVGEQLKLDHWRQRLDKNGYHHVSEVREAGEYVVRGGVLDIYPMGGLEAFRIELFDDEVESIRVFDTDSQLTVRQVQQIQVMPANEFPFDDKARTLFLSRFREQFDVDTGRSEIYQDVRKGLHFSGIEHYLPMFHTELSDIFDYLPNDATVVHCHDSQAVLATWEKQIQARYEDRRHDLQRPLLTPDALYLTAEYTGQQMTAFRQVWINNKHVDAVQVNLHSNLIKKPDLEQQTMTDYFNRSQDRVLITLDSPGRLDIVQEKLKKAAPSFSYFNNINDFLASDALRGLTVASIEHGVYLKNLGLRIYDEGLLFSRRVSRRQQGKKFQANPEDIISNLTDLHLDSPIVHIDHGVGRYRGLKMLDYDGEAEYLEVEYQGGDKLFVPVSSLHLVSRYSGAGSEAAPWHKLGSETWAKAKQKAAKKVKDVAAELLSIYAMREAAGGQPISINEQEYRLFCDGFPFTETDDQLQAIAAVKQDMQANTHMDRVICGDVGFGKTEIAMRAAFLAANDGQQVIMLVPTTLLAQQHYDNFLDRFAPFPIRVELLSRFVSTKHTKEVIAGMADGTVDIVIGTHKLLQKNLKIKNLGLVIVDEEQRFGVRQKDRLKQLKADVDLLTLTATPIPRTLNSALSGLRDLSIIATPPKARLSIKTQVVEWNKSLINEACTREIQRGGQVYFLHNEVQTIEQMAEQVQKINPKARVRIAHGQMHEQELQQVMVDFHKQRFNILVCTTIIESGIDIPNANTMIINRADKLGLAQLHQLRGRVGRSHHKAFAYLIIPGWKAITKDAKKRLEAIESLEDLGAGFTLATHDMEIRGSGELLGEEQSGQIQNIGFTLYCEMLERAVAALKKGEDIDLIADNESHVDVELNIPALIPEDYIFDVYTRLTFYKRMNNAKDADALDNIRAELVDRFGQLPEYASNLFHVLKIRLRAVKMHITRLIMTEEHADLKFNHPEQSFYTGLIKLLQTEPNRFKPLPDNGLRYIGDFETAEQRIDAVYQLLEMLR
ncbi:transcription-repair coupling factor [Marinicella gelatinilytica]|uniref:transcription-repair coupling factor n=1 Tax=Marinicella gelatinilytica TaxID=2996017 RepID=UPI002260BEF7|nr:transcription-repair coupling factor [Marinicella gelatinilytica]MCX7543856.1 transcription-repair coupling factor [Marinicella gelatinilytica]